MRIGVFIDGQNITIGARYAFGHGPMHPLLLARELVGRHLRTGDLVEVRYATGIPSPQFDPDRHQAQRRRHEVMVATDVVVLEKPLRYRWEWQVRDRSLGDPYRNQAMVTKARVESRNKGQEKGIDVWLALDALVMCTRHDLDVVIVATADSDLDLVPDYLRMIPTNASTKVLQAKVVAPGQTARPNPAYDETVPIDESVFEACRDDIDYTQPLVERDIATLVERLGVARDGVRD